MTNQNPLVKLSVDNFLRTADSSLRKKSAASNIVKKYRSFLEHFSDVVFITDEDGYFVFVNKTGEQSSGVPAEVFIGRHFTEIVYPKHHEFAKRYFQKALSGKKDVPTIEIERQTVSGEKIFKEVNWTILSGNSAERLLMGVSRDVTGRKLAQEGVKRARDGLEMRVKERTTELEKANELLAEQINERIRAEQELKKSEAKYRRLFELSGDAIFIFDVETGKILDANRRAEQLTGRSKQEIVGMQQSRLHPVRDFDCFTRKFQKHQTDGSFFDLEAEVVKKNGGVVPVSIYSNLIDHQGKSVIQGIYQDLSKERLITDLKSELKAKRIVNRAKAIIAAHYKINDGDALKLLQRESRRQNRKIEDLAAAVISSKSILLNSINWRH